MSLFKRAADILRANINDLLSKAEDPELMMNQYIQDAEDGLRESKTAVHEAITAEKELQGQWDDAEAEFQRWQERAELAAKKGNKDLVVEAVSQKRSAQSRLDGLKDPLAQAKLNTATFRTQVEALEQRIEEAQQKKSSLVARAKMAKARQTTADAIAHVSTNDPTAGMSSMEAKVKHLEAAAVASDELLHTHRSDVEERFKALETEGSGGSVDDEVEALMAKHGQAASAT